MYLYVVDLGSIHITVCHSVMRVAYMYVYKCKVEGQTYTLTVYIGLYMICTWIGEHC